MLSLYIILYHRPTQQLEHKIKCYILYEKTNSLAKKIDYRPVLIIFLVVRETDYCKGTCYRWRTYSPHVTNLMNS
jgi:hypothetical protein